MYLQKSTEVKNKFCTEVFDCIIVCSQSSRNAEGKWWTETPHLAAVLWHNSQDVLAEMMLDMKIRIL